MFDSKILTYTMDTKIRKKWRLMHATDFQSLMYPCFVFCRILVIFPYKIDASTFKISKPCYFLSSVIICTCCVCYLILIHSIIISKTFTYGDVPKNIEVVCYCTFSSFIVIITFILSGPRMRLLQTTLEISSKLSSESYQKLSRIIHVKDILCLILLIMQEYLFFFKVHPQLEVNCLNVLFGMYINTVVFQMNMLYINCVCVLKTCFKSINDNLMQMERLMVNNIELCVTSLICHVQKNQFLLKELKTMKKQHLMISETVRVLNLIFSLQLLATVSISFIEITFELYFYIVRWKDGVFITFDWYFLDVFLTSMVYYILKLTLIVWACETSKNQAQEIGTTIYSVLNNTRNEQIKDELELFSLQILHCKSTFSAKGLTIDATLLTAMFGSITTYILILIQFLITSHSCDEKSVINNT
ncbi:PREDICTED: putative gustatory receptor 23a, isoform B isoform X2 [Wasmannia auropunctata]|uniref:putative gustatory receptor 23a, isoform B isoform X2 n=1 Tax=Wasmannia auropunctata TaxID=64793 RepID=UPI0005EF74BF|nr:PREDICTED: putative gustatory receptor 23a, isoform B isoform X2 [Wasmannia auropunctata]